MADNNPGLTKARKQELANDASYLEAVARFDPGLREAVTEKVEPLSALLSRGMYLLNYRKDLGEENYQKLLKFQDLSIQEAAEALFFVYCVAKIRKNRQERLAQVKHLKLARAEKNNE